MVPLPKLLLDSLEGVRGFDKEAFESIHASGEQVTSIRINPLKIQSSSQVPSTGVIASGAKQGDLGEAVLWSQFGYYLPHRPSFTFDPLFHAGCYYVQEASGMFLEQALKQTRDLSQSLRILDLSAAPGGKSTHIQSLISKDSLLVTNDVIRSRANILKENIIKWGCENAVVTNNDPRDFAKLKNYFDVIVVDAPCSGSGLFRRDPAAIDEWSVNNVTLCSQRQQRILADVWPALKNDGILIYSTCSYSKEEDENIMGWVEKELRVTGYELWVDEKWGITKTYTDSGAAGFRFWPDKIKGEGFFIACFRKTDGSDYEPVKNRSRIETTTKKENAIIENWVGKTDHHLVKHENTVYAWPGNVTNDMQQLFANLRVIYSGVRIGELMRDKLVPDHALAMSRLTRSVASCELNYEQAIQYLQRKDMRVEAVGKGWQLVNYEGHSLGWINVLPTRINNYYPKELRILKDKDI